MSDVKLNLGCGKDYREGYINVDLYEDSADQRFDVKTIPYEDNTVDEILASHVIEHFDYHESVDVLKEWYRVLKPGGKLVLETPDMLESCREFVNTDEEHRVYLLGHFLAQPWVPGQLHKMLFTETQMRQHLGWAGFDPNKAKRIEPVSKYIHVYPSRVFLAMEIIK